ncbi:MAG: hypothetical protein JXA74_07605, partial [Anaerolineae bacterium]|nr:hypothetical protein [Anaerolineae bacterium]
QVPHNRRTAMLSLAAYAVLFVLMMTVARKKFDRYALPALLALDVAGAVGLVAFVDLIWAGIAPRHIPRRMISIRDWAPAFAILLQALILLAPLFPGNLVAYYNPWMGGLRGALDAISVGWGEGLGQMADYLAAKPEAEQLTVASWAVAGLAPRFPGRVLIPTEENLPQADYVLLYIADVQARSPWVGLLQDGQSPEHIVHVRGIPYAWLYRNRYVEELAAVIGASAGGGDAIVLSLPSAFERAYDGPLPTRTIMGTTEAAAAQQLAGLYEEMGLSSLHRIFFVDFDADTPSRAWIRRQLAQNGLLLWEQPFAFGQVRCYQLLEDASFRQVRGTRPSGALFGDQLRLQGYGLASHRVQYRQEIGVALEFAALSPENEDLHVFLHLLDDQGNRWAQRDGPLVDEMSRRSSEWAPGSEHLCHFGVPLSPGIVPGPYTFVMGLYTLEDVARLPISLDGSGAQMTALELAEIDVVSALVPPAVADLEIPHSMAARLADEIELLGHDLGSRTLSTGDELTWSLWWRCLASPDREYALQVALSQGDSILATERFAPTGPAYETKAWEPGEILRYVYRYVISLGLENGPYDVSVRLLAEPATQAPPEPGIILTQIELISPDRVLAPPEIPTPLSVQLGDAIELVGYDLTYGAAEGGGVAPGQSLELTLFWHAREHPQQAYTVFVHLLAPTGAIHSQVDSQPQSGDRPTRAWARGEYLIDRYTLALQPDAPPGLYHIAVGMYDAATGLRLPVIDGGSASIDDRRILLPDALQVIAR